MNRIDAWRNKQAYLNFRININGTEDYLFFGSRKIKKEVFDPKFLEEIKRRNKIIITT